MIKNNTSLIIPSAGFAKRLYPLSQNLPKILIKLNGVPLFHLFYKKAQELKVNNIIIAINSEFKRQLEEFVENTYKNLAIPIHIVEVDNPNAGVLYSVYKATSYKECKNNALIMLSDTLYTEKIPLNDKSFVIYKKVEPPLNRWCLVETDEFGIVKKFWDKPQKECPTNKALIGIYYVVTRFFNDSAKTVLKGKEKVRGEFQLSQALNKYKNKHSLFTIKAEKDAWHDTGTLITLKNASLDFFVSRNFNYIKIKEGKLIKESSNKNKLRNEFIWYQNVKNKTIIPRIYDYKELPDKAQLEMEICNLNDLGTIFNFCNAEEVFFRQTIKYLLEVMNKEFYNCNVSADTKYNDRMFLEKMLERTGMNQIGVYLGLGSKTKNKFIMALDEIAQRKFYSKIHGDLICSNILFDPQKMVIKLIDPRGEYGGLGIFGDYRYDLAKLLHSVNGYERIIHDLFIIKDEKITFYNSKEKEKCFQACENEIIQFAKEKSITKKELKIIETSIFLSNIPLHSDNKNRQRAFYLLAKKILKENL